MYALTQTNFVMNDVGSLHANLAVIADVDDWAAVLKLAEFPGPIDETLMEEPLSDLHLKYFPSNVNGFSRATVLRLCYLLAMDSFSCRTTRRQPVV
jgi:hypothetical protein